MSKSLRSIEDSKRPYVIAKRLSGGSRGLGYWAAVDAHKKTTGEDLGDYSKK